MAFSGYLIKLKKGTASAVLPLKYMKYETYKITPNQRMDYNSTRNTNGVLVRNAMPHTASKIEFDTPPFGDNDVNSMMSLIRSYWSNASERKVSLEYWDMETGAYKSGVFYMPDIQFTIRNIDGNHINYMGTRIAFIEY